MKNKYFVVIGIALVLAALGYYYALPKYQEHQQKKQMAEFFGTDPATVGTGSNDDFFAEHPKKKA